MRRQDARELAAVLHRRFQPEGTAVSRPTGRREETGYRGHTSYHEWVVELRLGDSVLRTSSLFDGVNFIYWGGR